MKRDKLVADPLLEEHTCFSKENQCEMLKLCVETTYLEMESKIYRQEGLTIGSLLSTVFDNIYKEYFEEMTSGFISLKALLLPRYVDDTFIL